MVLKKSKKTFEKMDENTIFLLEMAELSSRKNCHNFFGCKSAKSTKLYLQS